MPSPSQLPLLIHMLFPSWPRTAALACGGIALGLVTLACYQQAAERGTIRLREAASHQLDLLGAVIEHDLQRHAAIPLAMLNDQRVQQLLIRPSGPSRLRLDVSRYASALNDSLGGLGVFLLDTHGRVLASSDWMLSDNLIDMDLSDQLYFREALSGVPVQMYGIDRLRGEAGFYFAQPVRDSGPEWRVIGVAVVKSGLAGLERRWFSETMPIVLADASGIVLLASPPGWRYASLTGLPAEELARLSTSQFGGVPLGQLSLDLPLDALSGERPVQLPRAAQMGGLSADVLYAPVVRSVSGISARLVMFSDLRPVRREALWLSAVTLMAVMLLLVCILYLRQRRRLATQGERARRQLERKVESRTAGLRHLVARLRTEIGQRQRTETTLRVAQDELVHASRLAVLGQMASGITHELSQPLGAIRVLSENAIEFMRRGDNSTAGHNLELIGQLTEQMGGIITPFKALARKAPAAPVSLLLETAVKLALFLAERRIRSMGVTLHLDPALAGCRVHFDPHRLQQVLLNLIGNALDAMGSRAGPALSFLVKQVSPTHVILCVSDNGSGFTDQTFPRLFEAFFSTKPAGEGLGLGLAISRDILRDGGGDLWADNDPAGGARLHVLLPLAKEGSVC